MKNIIDSAPKKRCANSLQKFRFFIRDMPAEGNADGYGAHFYTIVVDKCIQRGVRVLPKSFVSRHWGTMRNPVLLKLPNGSKRKVFWKKCGEDKVWFHKGWRQCIECLHLEQWNFLLFHYSGNAQFSISVFDKSALQREYCSNFFKVVVDPSYKNGELMIPQPFVNSNWKRMKNPVTLSLPNGTQWKVGWNHEGGENNCVKFCQGWREFIEYFHVQVWQFLVFQYEGLLEGNSRFNVMVFGKDCLEIEYPPQSHNLALKPEPILPFDAPVHTSSANQPIWVVTLSTARSKRNQTLSIPINVAQAHFSHRPNEVVVQVLGGETMMWSIRWETNRPERGYFCHGWYEFVKHAPLLDKGDTLKFWKRDNGILELEHQKGDSNS